MRTYLAMLILVIASATISSGCDRETTHEETVKTRSDGTKIKEEKTVTEHNDGTVTKEEKKSVERPNP